MRALTSLLFPLIAGLAAACGGGGDDGGNGAPIGVPIVLGPQEVCGVDFAATRPDVTVFGGDTGDFLGDRFSLTTGDFNNDGLDDLLIGAPLADGPDNGRENAGEAYIIFGSDAPPSMIDLADGADAGVIGSAPGDNLGFTVATGDVNGDGTDDAIIGARFAMSNDRPAAGKAHVIYGAEDLGGTLDTAEASADVTISGGLAGDFLTVALAAGDLDGDGSDEILMGAAGSDGPRGSRVDGGAVFVVKGGADLPAEIDLGFEDPALTVYGARTTDSIPNHLRAGDLDGDGREELIIGAPFVDSADFEDAGSVYIVPGSTGGETVDLADSGDVTRLTGAARKDALGFEVGAADINGDGVADLLAGARDADGPQDQVNNGGEIHMMLGGGDLPRSVDLSSDDADALITSGEEGDSVGFTVATGDLDGDGLADVIAGAPLADSCDNARPDGGEVYVVNGRTEVPATVTTKGVGDLGYHGAQEGDAAGFSAAAGDFNGDGKADLVIGALQADGPDDSRPDGGEVYVVFSD